MVGRHISRSCLIESSVFKTSGGGRHVETDVGEKRAERSEGIGAGCLSSCFRLKNVFIWDLIRLKNVVDRMALRLKNVSAMCDAFTAMPK